MPVGLRALGVNLANSMSLSVHLLPTRLVYAGDPAKSQVDPPCASRELFLCSSHPVRLRVWVSPRVYSIHNSSRVKFKLLSAMESGLLIDGLGIEVASGS